MNKRMYQRAGMAKLGTQGRALFAPTAKLKPYKSLGTDGTCLMVPSGLPGITVRPFIFGRL